MVTLIPITTQASPYWDSLVRIYRASFPIDEQRPVESIARLITEEPRYTMYAIVDDNDNYDDNKNRHPEGILSTKLYTLNTKPYTLNPKQTLGLLTTWEFADFIYIEHFAIDPEVRSRGYGSTTLSTFIKKYGKPIVLEAEPPTDDITHRRIRFYERQGLTLYDFPYLQPAYTEASQPVELRLMGTLDIHATPLPHVSNTLHREVYGGIVQ